MTELENLERKLRKLSGEVAKMQKPVKWALDAVSWVTSKIVGSARVAASLEKIPELEKRIVVAMKPLCRLAA